jgi:hypothetical protein
VRHPRPGMCSWRGAMNIPSFPVLDELVRSSPLIVPRELAAVLEEDSPARGSFVRLTERERRSFAHYVSDARLPQIRERRAALVAMSLVALASQRRLGTD